MKKVLGAVIVAAVLAVLATGAAIADVAVPKDTIRVLAAGHQIDYPDKLFFRLQAEGDATITEVRLFYSVGGRPVQVYGYADFEPGLQVSADFEVETSGSSYIPTGVEIEYYYQITDVNGGTVETTPWSFEYRDPRYRWESMTIGSLTVLWHDISARRVAQAAQQVASRIEDIKPVFGIEDVQPMKAVIVNGSREARRSFPFISDASTRGHYFAGFAFDEYDLFLMQGLDTDTMIHEATHLLVHQSADSALARVPAWLNEGLAMQFEDRSIVRSATVRSAARAGRLLSLKNMGAVPGRSRDISLFYAQAWSVVDYMMDTYGPAKISALLTELNTGQRVDEALVTVYGLSVDELDEEWRYDLLGVTPIAPRPDPGSVATSLMITGAGAAAVTAAAWPWIWRWLRGPGQEGPVRPPG